MKKTVLLVIVLLAAATLQSCEKNTLEGLWVVQHVKVNEHEMTPNARWMQFNADGTQQSGNGWFQHSIGTWSLDDNTQELTVVNTNGINDPSGPFHVKVDKDTMTWNRIEEGEQVEVKLVKTQQLPQTYGDRLLGLWKLKEATGEYTYFAPSDKTNSTDYIFFRWDKHFVIQSENGKVNGVYNVHGHKSEVELIPYGDDLERNFWQVEFVDNTITITLLNSESPVTRKFVRIHDFPK